MTDKKDRAQEYLRNAERADAEADKSESSDAAEGFRNIAAQWRELARSTLMCRGR